MNAPPTMVSESAQTIIVAAMAAALVGAAVWQGIQGRRKPWRRWTHLAAIFVGPTIMFIVVASLTVIDWSRQRRWAQRQGMVFLDREAGVERWERPDGSASISFPVETISDAVLVFGALSVWSAVPWVISRATSRWVAIRRQPRSV